MDLSGELSLSFDLHTHTVYSHGKGSVEDNAARAEKAGLSLLGISDHGPGHLLYGVDISKIKSVRADIARASEAHPDLGIQLGVEANIIEPSGKLDISPEEYGLFDYIMAGYHYGLVSREEPVRSLWMAGTGRIGIPSKRTESHLTDMVIAAVYGCPLKVLTHPGDKIMVDIDAVSKACEDRGTWMEINCHHLALSEASLKKAMKYNVTFVIGSDAHIPANVGDPGPCLQIVRRSGLDLSRIVNLRS